MQREGAGKGRAGYPLSARRAPADVPRNYANASPESLLPLGVPQVMIWGEYEDFVPMPLLDAYVAAARAAGDDGRAVMVKGAGHFEATSPRSIAWPTVLGAIKTLLGQRPDL